MGSRDTLDANKTLKIKTKLMVLSFQSPKGHPLSPPSGHTVFFQVMGISSQSQCGVNSKVPLCIPIGKDIK